MTFVGDGPSRNILEKVAATLSADIYFVGNSNQVNDYLTNSELPSLSQGNTLWPQ